MPITSFTKCNNTWDINITEWLVPDHVIWWWGVLVHTEDLSNKEIKNLKSMTQLELRKILDPKFISNSISVKI